MTVRFLNVTRCLNFSNFHIARMFSTTFWRGLLSIFLFCSLWLYFYFVKHKKVSNEINILERRTASAHQQYNLIIYMRNKRNGREPHWGAATAKLHIDFVFVCKSSSFCSCFWMSSFCYGLIGRCGFFSAYSFPILFALEAKRFILIC